MPCNIGYKNSAEIVIPVPAPQTFRAEVNAPELDADLLAKLGNEDPKFLEWLGELDTKPLLNEALKRALARMPANGIEFSVNTQGMLEAKGRYVSTSEKDMLAGTTARVSERWQFEILGIVTELLGYTTTIRKRTNNELTLEAEEEGKAHPCDFIKVTKKDNDATLVFEHFKLRSALEMGTARFLALAHRLGVKIALVNSVLSEGDPFPGEERHRHPRGHHHDHDH